MMYRRTTMLLGTFLAVAVSLGMGADAASPAGMTAEQVIERNVTARGGLQAWRGVQTLSMSGKLEAGGNESSTYPVQGVKRGGTTSQASGRANAVTFSVGVETFAQIAFGNRFSRADGDPDVRRYTWVEASSFPESA